MEPDLRCHIFRNLDGAEERLKPMLALRLSKEGKLQQCLTVNVEKAGGPLGYHIETVYEWHDFPSEL